MIAALEIYCHFKKYKWVLDLKDRSSQIHFTNVKQGAINHNYISMVISPQFHVNEYSFIWNKSYSV